MQSFAAANVNDIRIRWRDHDRADRCCRLIIENWLPGAAVIDRFENAAVHRRHVENVRLRRDTTDGAGPPAAVRSNIPPAQNRIELSPAHLPDSQNNCETDYNDISNRSHKAPLSSAVAKFATRVLLTAQIGAIHRIARKRSSRGKLRWLRSTAPAYITFNLSTPKLL